MNIWPRWWIFLTVNNVKEVWGEVLFRVTGYHEASKLWVLQYAGLSALNKSTNTATNTPPHLILCFHFLWMLKKKWRSHDILPWSISGECSYPRKYVTRSIIASQESAHTLSVIGRLTKVPSPPKLSDDWKQVLENPDCLSYAKLSSRLHNLEREPSIIVVQ